MASPSSRQAKRSGDKPVASIYSLKLGVFDRGKQITWVSGMVPQDLDGTRVQHTFLYKDAQSKLVQINFWGEIEIRKLDDVVITTFPATKATEVGPQDEPTDENTIRTGASHEDH